MAEDIVFNVNIPCDNDGFVLLNCQHCGTFFKLTGNDIQDDGILNIYCPSCGLISDVYITDEVIALAQTKITNYAMDMTYDAFKDMERQSKRGVLQFKAGRRPSHERENPIKSGIEALEITEFKCCKRKAKIKPLLKFTGCYCPFCGVKEYEVE